MPYAPFDPFLHGFVEFNPCIPVQGFQGGEFLNAKDVLMGIGMALEPIEFVIPDESSCVTNNNNVDGRNAIKRNKSINKDNGMMEHLLSSRTTTGGSKKSKSMKGQWTVEEDKLLVRLVEIYGVRKWSQIAQMMKGRIGKQCRERWHNHLRPDIKKDEWTEEEDRILIEAHSQVGNKWAEIAKRLSGRTENSIKNHWNATKRRQFSRRKCRTKWPKPSHILQSYIKSLYSEKTSNKESKYDNDTSPQTITNVDTHTKVSELDIDLDDVLDFTFDDFQAFEGTSIDSSPADVPNIYDEMCFDFELPFDVSSIIPM